MKIQIRTTAQSNLSSSKLECIKLLKYAADLGLKESKDLIDLLYGGESINVDVNEGAELQALKKFLKENNIQCMEEGQKEEAQLHSSTPNNLLKLRAGRNSSGKLIEMVRKIELIKLLRSGSGGELGLKEAKDLMDRILEGETVEYHLVSPEFKEEFYELCREESIEILSAQSQATTRKVLVLQEFQGNFYMDLDLRNALSTYAHLSTFEAMTVVDGLRFCKEYSLQVADEHWAEVEKALNKCEVRYTIKQQATAAPAQSNDYNPNPNIIRCRLVLAGNFENKLQLVKSLIAVHPEKSLSLADAKKIADNLQEDKDQEMLVAANLWAQFQQEIANSGIQAIKI